MNENILKNVDKANYQLKKLQNRKWMNKTSKIIIVLLALALLLYLSIQWLSKREGFLEEVKKLINF